MAAFTDYGTQVYISDYASTSTTAVVSFNNTVTDSTFPDITYIETPPREPPAAPIFRRGQSPRPYYSFKRNKIERPYTPPRLPRTMMSRRQKYQQKRKNWV